MKKKLLYIIFMLTTLFLFSGCQKEVEQEVKIESQTQSQNQDTEEATKNENELVSDETPVVCFDYVTQMVYLINSQNQISQIDFGIEDRDVLDYLFLENGKIQFGFEKSNSDGTKTIVAKQANLDGSNMETLLEETIDQFSNATVDFYQDKIYITENTYGEDGEEHFTQTTYVKDGSGKYMKEGVDDEPFAKFNDQGYSVIFANRSEYNYGNYTVPYCMKQFGYIIMRNVEENTLGIFDENGALQKSVAFPPSDSGIEYAYGENIVYHVTSDDATDMVIYNLREEKEVARIKEENDLYSSILQLDANNLFYYTSQSIDLRSTHFTVYQYNIQDQTSKIMFETESKPGMDSAYFPGIANFCVGNGSCYYIDNSNHDLNWYRYDLGRGEIVDLGVSVMHADVLDYGTITPSRMEKQCPICGIDVFEGYKEKYRLNDDVPNADIINQKLEENDQNYNMEMPSDEVITEEHEMHGEDYYPKQYQEHAIDTVKKIKSHYLEIGYSDYYYYGGAHGQSAYEYYLFDLNTGEQKTITDFYQGTEADFKATVLEYLVPYWEQNKDMFFSQEETEFREQATSSTSFDMLMEFTETGIKVYYYPYDLTPYAAGFVEIEIPYEALNIQI